MNAEQRKKLAQQLVGNKLLEELLEARRQELREMWETSETLEERETAYHAVRALIDLRDFINGRIEQLAGRDR